MWSNKTAEVSVLVLPKGLRREDQKRSLNLRLSKRLALRAQESDMRNAATLSLGPLPVGTQHAKGFFFSFFAECV